MKAAKVICVYMGPRRARNNNATTPEGVLEYAKEMVRLEREIDPGVDTDTIIINNQAGFHAGNVFLDSLNGTPTKRGKFIVHTRENVGGSFAAYNHAFQLYKDKYDWWMFVEDDVFVTCDGLIDGAIKYMGEYPDIGFIALAPVCPAPAHCGGGCGVTSTEMLKKAASTNGGVLPYTAGKNYAQLEVAEVQFTNIYHRMGFRIENLPWASPMASNWQKHDSQIRWSHLDDPANKVYVYKVGM